MQQGEQAALAYALRLLGRREYCEADIRRKLMLRECAPEVIDTVIERLKAENYLSDARYAEGYLRGRLKKGEVPWLAARRAKERGVDASALAGALDDAKAGFDALASCRELLARRDPQRLRHTDEKQWQKLARFLRNKGFDAATILRVMNEKVEDPR
ncbi:MAG TPA: regulatory protein RecX [Mariprofundaceae bacterium]|nr:regulatory protein RecX [Mariprofundaceae bacterium]